MSNFVSNLAFIEAPKGVVIDFPHVPVTKKKPPNNAKKGGYQTVYPLKKKSEILAVAKWLHENQDPKYLLAFTMGINLGLRANELLELKTQDVFWPDGSIRRIEDKQDVTDGCAIFQSKQKKNRIYIVFVLPVILKRSSILSPTTQIMSSPEQSNHCFSLSSKEYF